MICVLFDIYRSVTVYLIQDRGAGMLDNVYMGTEVREHAEPTHRHPDAYEAHLVLGSFGFKQISRLF